MSEKTSENGHKLPNDVLTTAVGSTAAVIGVLGVMALANTAPVVAALLGAGSTAVAAGALYRKLTDQKNRTGHAK
jgi:hypothetical protein